jgi:hypothetical protein
MKGIYLTEEAKQQLEAKIAEFEEHEFQNPPVPADGIVLGSIYQLTQILLSATILPVEESWDKIDDKIINAVINNEVFNKPYHEIEYPNGVIIQLKNKDANNSRISG